MYLISRFCLCFIFLNPELNALVTNHLNINKEILERYIGLVQSNYKPNLQMETLMTVLKRFWLNYKLKKTVNRRKSASQKQHQRDFFSMSDS